MASRRELLKKRLQEEGRWTAYVERREALKASGIPASDAWRQAAIEFSPCDVSLPKPSIDFPLPEDSAILASPPSPLRESELEDPPILEKRSPRGEFSKDEFSSTSSVNIRDAVVWVFDNMGIKDLEPKDAPSSGAWFLLQEIRSSSELRKEFYRSTMPRVMPTKSQLEELLEKHADDGRNQFEIIETLQGAIEQGLFAASSEGSPGESQLSEEDNI